MQRLIRSAYARPRFDALTDGVFAVAMTLLVLDVRVPDGVRVEDAAALWQALAGLWPKAFAYGLSFAVVGLAWLSRATAEAMPATMSRREALIGLAYLLCVTLVPFSTIVLGRYGQLTPAIWIYSANLGLMGLLAAAMRAQAPPSERDDRHGARVVGSLMLTAGACLTAVMAAAGMKNALAGFVITAFSPFVDRVANRAGR